MDDLIEREGMQILLPPASGVDGEFLDGWCAGQAYLIANYGTDEAFDRAADVANRIAALEADKARLMGLLKEAGEALEAIQQRHGWCAGRCRACDQAETTLAKIKEATDAE